MAFYFLSDVHLRHDYPERGERLARLVARLERDDHLVVVGDLVDFFFASRQRYDHSRPCPGLEAIARFRDRGGSLQILPGNHDGHLDAEYSGRFGTGFCGDQLDLVVNGLRVHAIHGHRVGVRSALKVAMESQAFLHAFGLTPGPIARRLDRKLNSSNQRHRDAVDAGHLQKFRAYAQENQDKADLFVFGHVHRVIDERSSPRLIVLGGWHGQSSYLRLDDHGASLLVEQDI